MFDLSHLPSPAVRAESYYFVGPPVGSHSNYIVWQKPRGKTMMSLLLVGSGGIGGNGVVGANSTAAGGGGGGSGTQVNLLMPLHMLPDSLYILLGNGGTYDGIVLLDVTNVAQNCLARAPAGGNGGNASGATAGTAGAAGATPSAGSMPLGWTFSKVLAGQAGVAGGTTGAGTSLTLPVTGLLVTGGTGGAGLGNAGSNGSPAPSINGAGAFITSSGGAGGSSSVPPKHGSDGFFPIRGLHYGYGGTGGGSTGGSATGVALLQANGGNGAPGCGGGGSGGAKTGSTPGIAGRGGPAFCVITCW